MPSDICCVLFEYRFSIPAPVKRRHRALVVTNFVSLISVPSTKNSLTPLFLLSPKSLPTFRGSPRSWHSHIPFGLLFNFQGTVRRSFTYSHWEEQNYRVVLKNFLFCKRPLHSFGQRVPKCTPISGLFPEKFFEKKFTLHLFGITKPNDTLFLRKTEKYFFRLRVLYFSCPEKPLHLFPPGASKCTP